MLYLSEVQGVCSQEPDFSGPASVVCSNLVLPISLITSDQHAGVFLPGWLGGQTSHMSPVMPWHLINHPWRLFGDPLERKGGTKEREGIGAVRAFACGMAGNASKDDSYPILP